MNLIEKIEDAGVEPLFDMRGKDQKPREFWHNFSMLEPGDIALFNVHALSSRRYDPFISIGTSHRPLQNVLQECRMQEIIPALQCHPVNGATSLRGERTLEFLRNVRAITQDSGVGEYLLMAKEQIHIQTIEEEWSDLLGPDVGTAFKGAVAYINSLLKARSFRASKFDVDLFALQLPADLQTREDTWLDTLHALELMRRKLKNPVRMVMVDPSWPDSGMEP